MNARLARRVALAAVPVLLAGAAWAVFGSAATLTVTPKNASAFRTCVLTGFPKASVAMSDAWVDETVAMTGSNKGTNANIQIRSSSLGDNRAFLSFDLAKCVPTIASAAAVKKATVRLNLGVDPGANRTYNLNRVTGSWTESGLTWSNQPAVAASPTSTLALTGSSAKQYYDFEVTTDVAAMVAGTTNYGWRIADSAENNTLAVTADFKAKDADSAATAPQLVVVYSP